MRHLLDWIRHNPFSRLYDEERLGAETRRSLTLMLMANICGTMFGIICGGSTTAMIGLANELHAGDLAYGLINGIPQAAALFQLPFSMLVNRTHKRKKYLLTLGLFSRALWLVFGFLPVLIPEGPFNLRLWSLIFLLGISSCCSSVINVCWFPWFSDLAPIGIRARWLSLRDMILSVCNFGFGLLTARLLDTLPENTRYIIIFLLGGTVGMMDMVCFGFCKEVYSAPPQQLKIRSIIQNVWNNKPFLRLIVMWTAWCFTANLCGPYLSRYSVNEMHLSYTQMMIFSTAAASVSTILVVPLWGRAMHRFGCRSVMMVSALVNAVVDAFYLLSTDGNVWPVFLRNFIGALFWSGANLSATSMQLSASPDEMRPSYIAMFSCITALVGTTLGTLAGGGLLEAWENAGLFSGSFDRYKALITLSVILRFAVAVIFVPPMENDREGTPMDLVRSLMFWKRRGSAR